MRIENWAVVSRVSNPYQAPELQTAVCGKVYDHARFNDGEVITTSGIASIDKDTSSVTTKSGSVYTLGEVDPAYEAQYPNARERLFKG